MPGLPNVVNIHDLEWQEMKFKEHYSGFSKQLTTNMPRENGHIGVRLGRLSPGSLSCPFHYHLHGDEFFLVMKGKVMLRYGDETQELTEGDAVSCPRGTGIAHQFYNHTDEDVEMLIVGENVPHEVCHYPDSDKWMSRAAQRVGKFVATDYWADEPEPPVMKSGS